MDLKAILAELNICKDVIKLILQYNATLLGFVPRDDGSISIQDYQTKKELRLLKYDESCSHSLLIIPEFNLVMRSFPSYRVCVWNFNTGDVMYSQGLDNNGRHLPKQVFYPILKRMFWVPKLKKAVVIFDNQIDILTVSKEGGAIMIERQSVGPVIHQRNVNLNQEEPQQINPFEFMITYDTWPPNHYQKVVIIFNLQTMLFRADDSKDEKWMFEGLRQLSQTSSLKLFLSVSDNGFRRLIVEENEFKLPVIINGLDGFQGTLENCIHVHDSEYRLLYFTYIPRQAIRQETDFRAILEFKGIHSFRIISGPLERDPTKAVLLSEHHHCEPTSNIDSYNSIRMYSISLALLFGFMWYFCR